MNNAEPETSDESSLVERVETSLNLEIIPNNQQVEIFQELLSQPKLKIAELITGGISEGLPGIKMAGVRLAQVALKGNALTQAGREINRLIEAGKIEEDYAEKKYGFKSLVELLKFIDSEEPEEDRLLAVIALFASVNAVGKTEGERLAHYEVMRRGMDLTSSQILVLKACYLLKKLPIFNVPGNISYHQWRDVIMKEIGHSVSILVDQDEEVLMDKGFLTSRRGSDKSIVLPKNARLSELGLMFCESVIGSMFKK